MLNIPDPAAQPGQMAIIYSVHPDEVPGSEGQPVYSIDLLGGRAGAPVMLNFIATQSMTRRRAFWNETAASSVGAVAHAERWMTGWPAASIDKPGLYRVDGFRPTRRRSPICWFTRIP